MNFSNLGCRLGTRAPWHSYELFKTVQVPAKCTLESYACHGVKAHFKRWEALDLVARAQGLVLVRIAVHRAHCGHPLQHSALLSVLLGRCNLTNMASMKGKRGASGDPQSAAPCSKIPFYLCSQYYIQKSCSLNSTVQSQFRLIPWPIPAVILFCPSTAEL